MQHTEHSSKSLCYDICNYKIKQATCIFQFVCKHTDWKHDIFCELWVLRRFKTAKVTLSLTQVIGNHASDGPYMISY